MAPEPQETHEPTSILLQVAMGRAKLENKKIISEPRKGTLTLCLSSNELHMQWKDRETGTIEQDWKLCPDSQFATVDGVQDGTIYVLKDGKGSKCFFWLQESPTRERDGAYYATRIQQLIHSHTKKDNHPSNSSLSDEYSSVTANSLEAVLQSLRQHYRAPLTDLRHILSRESLVPIFSNPNLEEQSLHSLFRYLPEDDQHRDGLVQILSSPGFREQVDILNAGLRSPYAPQLLYSLGFPEAVNDGPDYVKAFIRALIRKQNMDDE